MVHVFVFGASGEYGCWDFEQGGWVSRLRHFLDQQYQTDASKKSIIYNLGVNGELSDDIIERFENEFKMRIKRAIKLDRSFVIIFAVGKNDSQFVHSENRYGNSLEKFKQNIQKLITTAKNLPAKTIFMEILPVDESRTSPWAKNKNLTYKIEVIRQYNEIVNSVCAENNIPIIKIFDQLMNTDYKLLFEDGLHPNSKGHEKIFEIVKDFLIQNKII